MPASGRVPNKSLSNRGASYTLSPFVFFAAGCTPVLIGTIDDFNDSVTVTWGGGTTYSSVEVQAVNAKGECVYSANKETAGGDASITVNYQDCEPDYPFVNGGPTSVGGNFCDNYMCA